MKILSFPQSGSVANQTASRNTFGQYLRARVGRGGTPAGPLTGAVAAWQNLSADQQRAWGDWAAQVRRRDSLGQERILSGYLQFVSSFHLADSVGVLLTDPPEARSDYALVSAAISLVAPGIVQLDAAVGGSGTGWVQFWFTRPWSSTGTLSPPGRAAYWKMAGAGPVTAPGTLYSQQTFSPPGPARVFGYVRAVGPDWILGPRLRAPGFVLL